MPEMPENKLTGVNKGQNMMKQFNFYGIYFQLTLSNVINAMLFIFSKQDQF